MININDVCNYVIFRTTGEGNGSLSHLKLQKFLYYIQAWHLAFEKNPLFDGKFQAWIHGPVNREIYNRFKDSKYIYSAIDMTDIKDADLSFASINEPTKSHINIVLEAYARFSDTQLEEMTHQEDPWLEARTGYQPYQRCEVDISEKTMLDYYGSRVNG